MSRGMSMTAIVFGTLALTAGLALGGFADFDSRDRYRVGASPADIVTGDFNRDGHPDFAVTNFQAMNPNTITVLKGRSRGRLKVAKTYAVPEQPDGIDVGRINQGKDLDLVIAGLGDDALMIMRGDNGVRFHDPEALDVDAWPRRVTVGDFNRDGRDDIAVQRQFGQDVAVLNSAPGGGFEAPDMYPMGTMDVGAIEAARLNADGRLDLVLTQGGADEVRVMIGQPGGAFVVGDDFAAGPSPADIAITDLNRDGDRDLVVANFEPAPSGRNVVTALVGKGDGTFGAPRPFRVSPAGASFSARSRALRGIEGLVPSAVAVADFDRDGDRDLAVALEGSNKVALLRGKSGVDFGAPQFVRVDQGPAAVLAPRLDDDGRPDLVTANDAGGPRGTVVVRLKKP